MQIADEKHADNAGVCFPIHAEVPRQRQLCISHELVPAAAALFEIRALRGSILPSQVRPNLQGWCAQEF